MENLNILSVGGFLFFLLILSIWYIMVEIIFWEKYPFRKLLKQNDNSVLDRFIHYIIVWIFSNIVFFYILYFTNSHIPFVQIFDNSWSIGKWFSEIFGVEILSFQLIWSALFYFFFVIFLLFFFRFWISYTIDTIFKVIDFFKNKKTKKTKKKKTKNKS